MSQSTSSRQGSTNSRKKSKPKSDFESSAIDEVEEWLAGRYTGGSNSIILDPLVMLYFSPFFVGKRVLLSLLFYHKLKIDE